MPGPGFPLIRPISPPPTGTGTKPPLDTTAPWLSEKVDAALAERFQQRLCLKHIGCPAERNGANETPPAQPHSEHTSQKPDWHRAFAPDEAATLSAERETHAAYWRAMEARYPYLAAEGLPAATPPSEPHADAAPGLYVTPTTIASAERLTTPAVEAPPIIMPGRDATPAPPAAPEGFPIAEPPGATLLYHEQPRIDVDLGPVRPVDHGPGITRPTGERGGEPMGLLSVNLPNADSKHKPSIRNENVVATKLASAGYRVIQNPRIPPEQMTERGLDPEKDPDFIIEGRVFDLYTPTVKTAKQVYAGICRHCRQN